MTSHSLPIRRVTSQGMKGHIVDFLVLPEVNNVVAVVIWSGGGITTESLDGLVFVGTIEEDGPTEAIEGELGTGG